MIARRTFVQMPVAAWAAAGGKWEDRLGVMCQLGAEESRAREVLDAARDAGFRRVMVNFAWDQVSPEFLKSLPRWLGANGLRCEALGAYVNCVAPGTVLMNTRKEDLARAIGYAGELSCSRLVAWTGSHGADLMKPDSRNFTSQSEDALVRFVEEYCDRLEKARIALCLESYITLTCPDAPSLARVLARLPNTVAAVFDPPNLTPIARYAQRDEVLRSMARELRGRIGIVHLKDFRLAAGGDRYELPGPLAGVMNYPLLVREIQGLPEGVPVVAEHIGPREFAATRAKLLPLLNGA